jgi:outer membrane receptor protein involved in Fe transport
MRKRFSLGLIGLILAWSQASLAQEAATPDASGVVPLPDVDVVEGNGAAAAGAQSFGPQTFEDKINSFDYSRDNFLLPKFGASSFVFDQQALQALPQGDYTPIDKLLLQAPSVSYDSAVSNPDYHIRNEYANVQYRINGILLPEGVSGLGPVLETSFIGNLNLLTGALPAQYGLRTAGVVDITTPSQFAQGGNVAIYGGSLGTVSPSFEYGGATGDTQYFFTGRYNANNEGLENALPTPDPIHDQTYQEKYFGYVSTLLGESNRLTFITGAALGTFQIPNQLGIAPLGDFGGTSFNSANLNENEIDSYLFNIVALQTKGENFDTQLAAFTRSTTAHFIPDVYGDLVFNDVASDVTRQSFLGGVQFDGAYRLNEAHTLRGGFAVTAEQTNVDNFSLVLPLGADGEPLPTPLPINDYDAKLGWNLGGYVQDEWKITDTLTMNAGLRFDQLYQFVTANQLSPRLAFIYKPFPDTTLHAGYARYFTPPYQAQATPTNLALFNNTTQQPGIPLDSPVEPERSHYFDVGVDQKIGPNLTVGGDAFLKLATDQLDDGQFGQAIVLTQFNYARGYTEGLEFKAKYYNGGFTAYANFSTIRTKAIDIVSNQYLIDPDEFFYRLYNYVFTDDAQLITASGGASYRWQGFLASVDFIAGSGLRTGFGNLQSVQPYTQINLAVSQDFDVWQNQKPLNLRLAVVNLLDTLYLLRSGDGVGEFAPQYGPRRGFFATLTQKF